MEAIKTGREHQKNQIASSAETELPINMLKMSTDCPRRNGQPCCDVVRVEIVEYGSDNLRLPLGETTLASDLTPPIVWKRQRPTRNRWRSIRGLC